MTVAEVIDRLPDRLLSPKPIRKDDGSVDTPASIRAFTAELDEILLSEGVAGVSSHDLMTALGIPPSEWYLAGVQSGIQS